MPTWASGQWPCKTRSPARDWSIGLGLVILVAIVGYGFLLTSGKVPFSPYSDILTYHLGAKEAVFRAFQAWQGLAFWRSDQLAGTPAFTNPNVLATHPLHLLFCLMPPADAMGWTIWLRLVVGGVIAFPLLMATVVRLTLG
jgi:hypothetical protein